MKKGQGLSLNTIIIAAIVLIVLIVLWAIFTGRMGGFTGGIKETETKDCDDIGGDLSNKEGECPDDKPNAVKIPGLPGLQVCCVV